MKKLLLTLFAAAVPFSGVVAGQVNVGGYILESPRPGWVTFVDRKQNLWAGFEDKEVGNIVFMRVNERNPTFFYVMQVAYQGKDLGNKVVRLGKLIPARSAVDTVKTNCRAGVASVTTTTYYSYPFGGGEYTEVPRNPPVELKIVKGSPLHMVQDLACGIQSGEYKKFR